MRGMGVEGRVNERHLHSIAEFKHAHTLANSVELTIFFLFVFFFLLSTFFFSLALIDRLNV